MASFAATDILQQFRLDGKVSLVTGASRGLGRAMGEALAGAGSDVVLMGRDQATLEPVAVSIAERTGRKALAVPVDVRQTAQIETAVARVRDEFGRIDVLINNAGINLRNPAVEYTEQDWEQVLAVNTKGTFFMSQACGRVMIEQRRGKIINVLSMTCVMGLPTVVAYTASKSALVGLTKLLAVEWAPYNIQVNGLGPGFFRTELTRAVQNDQRSDWILHRTPAGRWGEPEDLAGAAVFLASPASDYITGQVLYVDGGMTAGSDWRSGL
jgi:NAD(P)-dependent dehydrogenase (short-subunit alcohol dehydrogenase family)